MEKQPGDGTLVRKNIDPFRTVINAETGFAGFEGPRMRQTWRPVTTGRNRPRLVEIQEAFGDIAKALDLDEGATLAVRHQERFVDDELWSMKTSYYPMAFVDFVDLAVPP
jgi:DNA-binding GntR family transcriptional regulator